jgi:probable phosphoglycerate mutase
MTRIVLIRHGHVEGIDPPRFRGRVDLALTELGRGQARATARRILQHWSPLAIYSSPMQRCLETAAPLAADTGLTVTPLADLHDLNYGACQWKTFEEARGMDSALFALWFTAPHLIRFPGGDLLQDLVLRTANAIRQMVKSHPGDTVVLVGHDSVNRALLLQLLDQPLSSYWRLPQAPCAINEVVIDHGVHVVRINETAHLELCDESLPSITPSAPTRSTPAS